ncbi:glycoside hydrolase family 76 protein [Bacteroides sp. OttesenSCG-928-J23]|nr:glycoside hydrolase family 76 protein [Bacteroides sp. OttesenSCG-928-N06]MDL2247171.1 glycoside hydrolase family 76 protein [Bacteroides sp. OttesenSCG-928-J23]MDL2303909.1 glycoside hydrolase family 76 protein [Bacteroides sp. OttesenSCG-928-D19]
MKKIWMVLLCLATLAGSCGSCEDSNNGENDKPGPKPGEETLAKQNLMRAMEIVDNAVDCYFQGEGMKMARYYNPYTQLRSDETGSIWMYTSSIEAVNAILHALKTAKEKGDAELYDKNFGRYTQLLAKLHENAAFYQGTFRLVSYTQTKEWTVYGVNRGRDKGAAAVEGVENVYDDQQWLVRELLEAYKLTGNQAYLTEAEYLTEYVLDGWDCTLDDAGNENGGIPWGPGYVTKHSCSNGPMVSPLVWLHELYKGKNDEIEHRYIDTDKSRKTEQVKKSEYYLTYAKKVYDWQKKHLLIPNSGVYDDMMGGYSSGDVLYETIDGVKYRAHTRLRDRVGPPITYNSGTMLSGAADLYRATADSKYLDDAKKLTDDSFRHFAKLGGTKPGYYTYDISGFRNWFNGVLMRGYVDAYPAYNNASVCIDSFQKNLDYGYDNFMYKSFLPTSLLVGWSRDNNNNKVEGMFTFAFAAEYAVLARYEMEREL